MKTDKLYIVFLISVLISSCMRNNLSPRPEIYLDLQYEKIYEKMEITFNLGNDNPPKGHRYRWSFGDNTYSDKVSPEKAYDKPGKYVVKLTQYNAELDSMSVFKEIEVLECEEKLICTFNRNDYEMYYNINSDYTYNKYFHQDLTCLSSDTSIRYAQVHGLDNNTIDFAMYIASRTIKSDGNRYDNADFINLYTGERALHTDSSQFVLFQVIDILGKRWSNKCKLTDIANSVKLDVLETNDLSTDIPKTQIRVKATINTKLYKEVTGEAGNFTGSFYFIHYN